MTGTEDWDHDSAVKKPPMKRLSSVVSVRFAPHEEEALRRLAEERGISLSQLVRQASLGLGQPSSGRVAKRATTSAAKEATVSYEWPGAHATSQSTPAPQALTASGSRR
jgi:pyruvate/2-oxoglutarate dehydrogenase complex dihydrolipoamide acyltransferase (E2) component